jgi:hypothetical protein
MINSYKRFEKGMEKYLNFGREDLPYLPKKNKFLILDAKTTAKMVVSLMKKIKRQNKRALKNGLIGKLNEDKSFKIYVTKSPKKK